MTFWITAYALTKGILRVDGMEETGGYARGPYGKHGMLFKRIGKDAFRTEKEAKARMRELIKAKLANLEKERKKLLGKLKSL